MQSTLLIKESLEIKGTKFKVHYINADDSHEGGWSRQISIYSGILDRSLKRWHYFWKEKKSKTHNSRLKFQRWHTDDEEVYLNQQKNMIREYDETMAKLSFPDYEKVYHNSIYDFLKYIDYDNKDKKVSNTDKLIMIQEK